MIALKYFETEETILKIKSRAPAEGTQCHGFVLLQVREQSKDHNSNPFLRKQCSQLAEPSMFRTVQQIPGVGKTKALLLLQQFGSIHQLCNASVKELELVVGQTVAQQIYAFLCS